jgi:hypothetical protein
MKWTAIIMGMLLTGGLISCREKADDPPHFVETSKPSSAEATAKIPYQPTNPSGGVIPGKGEPLDPEENARRQARNTAKPIVWGESIAGISLDTTREEATTILAQRLTTSGAFEIYPESIQIAWSNTQPRVPQIIVAFGTYGGELTLPEPIGKVSLGDDLSEHFESDPNGEQFMRTIGAHFEGQDPNSYDCRTELTCAPSVFNNLRFFEFKGGSIGVTSDYKLNLVYIVPNQNFFPRVTAPAVYGQSIGGVSLNSQRANVEAQIGRPQGQSGGLFYYDDLNMVIAWNLRNVPALVGAQEDFLGDIEFPEAIGGSRKIGDSMTSAINGVDVVGNSPAENLIISLDRALVEERAPDYNCLTEETCQVEAQDGTLLLNLAKGTYAVSDDADLNLQFVSLVPEQTSFAEE